MLQVTFTEEHVSFLHFLTNVCAIIGGRYGSSTVPAVLHKILNKFVRQVSFHLSESLTQPCFLFVAYRCFHCFWNTRFIYLSRSKGYQEEDGTW